MNSEAKSFIKQMKNSVSELESKYTNENFICERELDRIYTLVLLLRQEKQKNNS